MESSLALQMPPVNTCEQAGSRQVGRHRFKANAPFKQPCSLFKFDSDKTRTETPLFLSFSISFSSLYKHQCGV